MYKIQDNKFSRFLSKSLTIIMIVFITAVLATSLILSKYKIFAVDLKAAAALVYYAAVLLLTALFFARYKKSNVFTDMAVLFISSVTLSLPLIITANLNPVSDFAMYFQISGRILDNTLTGSNYVSAFPHTFGLSSALAAFMRVFGRSLLVARLAGLFFSSMSVLLLYLFCARFGSRKFAVVSSLLWLFFPSRIFYTLIICSENYFNFIAMLIAVCFALLAGSRNRRMVFLLSVLLGCLFAVLANVRPNYAIVMIAMLIVYFVYVKTPERFNGAYKAFTAVVMLAAFFAVSNINTAVVEQYIGQEVSKSKIGWNLYVGMNKESMGQWNQQDANSLVLSGGNADEVQKEFLDKGIVRVKELLKSGFLPFFMIQKAVVMWTGDCESAYYLWSEDGGGNIINYKENHLLIAVCNVYYRIVLALCLISLISYLRKKELSMVLMLSILIILGITSLHMIFEMGSRYHNHGLIWLCVIAAWWLKDFKRRKIA